MKTRSRNFVCSLAAGLGAGWFFCTDALADTPRNLPPVRITPEIIHDATLATQSSPTPARDGSSVLSRSDAMPPQHDIFRDSPRNLENIPNGCAHNSASLCYDYRTGSANYKPMRKLLPGIPGMTPHNLSIRRNKIVAQYTFK